MSIVRMFDRVLCGCLAAATSAITRYNIRTSADPHFTPGPLCNRASIVTRYICFPVMQQGWPI